MDESLAHMHYNALCAAKEFCWEKESQQLFRLDHDITGASPCREPIMHKSHSHLLKKQALERPAIENIIFHQETPATYAKTATQLARLPVTREYLSRLA